MKKPNRGDAMNNVVVLTIKSISAVFLILVTTSAFAWDFAPPGCGFSVVFPAKPKLGSFDSSGVSTPMAETPDGISPYMRAMCFSPIKQGKTQDLKQNMRKLLFKLAALQHLTDITITAYTKSKTVPGAWQIKLKGTNASTNPALTVYTSIFVLGRSALLVGIAEPTDKFPSKHVLDFLAGIKANAWDFAPAGCDFSVSFPVKPMFGSATELGMTATSAETPPGYVPDLRAVCFSPLSAIKKYGIEQTLQTILLRIVKVIGLIKPRIAVYHRSDGILEITMTARKNMNGAHLMFYDALLVGNESTISLAVTEPANIFPSKHALAFFGSEKLNK